MDTLLCRDCRFFTDKMPQCGAVGNNAKPDYINGGNASATYWSAQATRIDSAMCGPDAKWFEPKE